VRDQQLSSPGYVFLGRLVATLPEDEVSATDGYHWPRPPQAVVECNFWQFRGQGFRPGTPLVATPRSLDGQQTGWPPFSPPFSSAPRIALSLDAFASADDIAAVPGGSGGGGGANYSGRGEGAELEVDGMAPFRAAAVPDPSSLDYALSLLPAVRGTAAAGADDEEDEDLPPWPHEM